MPSACRRATLNDESRRDPVEEFARVHIIAIVGQVGDFTDRIRREVLEQLVSQGAGEVVRGIRGVGVRDADVPERSRGDGCGDIRVAGSDRVGLRVGGAAGGE